MTTLFKPVLFAFIVFGSTLTYANYNKKDHRWLMNFYKSESKVVKSNKSLLQRKPNSSIKITERRQEIQNNCSCSAKS